MSTLPQLTFEADRIFQIILENGGELTPDLERELTNIELSVADKIDRYDFIMDSLEERAKFLRKQAGEREAAARGLEHAAKYLKDNIKSHLLTLGKTEAEGVEIRFKLGDMAPKLNIDLNQLPENFKMVVTEMVPDKEKIKAALNLGEEVKGATLVPVYALRRVLNKGNKS